MAINIPIKDFLYQGITLDERIKDNELELQKIRLEAEGLKSQDFSEKVQMTPKTDRTAEMVIALLELSNLLTNQRIEFYKVKYQILELIETADKPEYKRLLHLRYIKCLKFEKIAVEMDYNFNYIHELHNKALINLEKKQKELRKTE